MISKKNALFLGAAAIVLAGAGISSCSKKESAAIEEAAVKPAAGGPATIAMTKQQIDASQIRVEEISGASIDSEIIAPGAVTASPGGEAVLTAGAGGTITRIFHRLGDPVRAGETIALVVSREGAGLAADRTAADAKVNLARQQLKREQSLFDQGVSPRQELEIAQATLAAAEAEAKRATAATSAAHVSADGRTVSVVTPISGRLTKAAVNLGEFVAPEAELFRVVDPKKIQIEVSVSAEDIDRVSAGAKAVIRSASGKQLSGVVRSITPSVDTETRQATAVLSVEGAETLASGQLVTARLFAQSAVKSEGFAVPQNSVQSMDSSSIVFVQTNEGFRVVPVEVLKRSSGLVQVSGAVKPGDRIATDNAFLLKSELGKADAE